MTRYVYVASETRENGSQRPEGIFVFQMDPSSGALQPVQSVQSGENPSFLAVHPNQRFLYCVNELREGRATSFALDPANGQLKMLNTAPVKGSSPCYISIDASGRWAFVANYGDGSLSVMRILEDGTIATGVDNVRHQGRGDDPLRQEGPHAHSILPAPGGNFVLAADLGTNRVYIYRMEEQFGVLAQHESVIAEAGAGPRHQVFHPTQPYYYVSNEMKNTVAVYWWDAHDGQLEPRQVMPTLPADYKEESTVADIHITPDGKYVYVSNRGHDSLAVFEVSAKGDQLKFIDWVSTEGHVPRNFSLSPDGRFILVGNQYSNTLALFEIKPNSGLPRFTGQLTQVYKPQFVTIVDL